MNENKFYEVQLKMLMHDFKCPDPDKMYFFELAEQVRFKKHQLEELCVKMEADGELDSIEKVLDDADLIREMFVKYNMPLERPEATAELREQNQLRCIKNVMNDFAITAEQAIQLLDINECEKEKYINLLK